MADHKTRILLMIDDASVGGGQQHVLWLAERMDRGLFEVAVACEPTGYLVDALAAHGIRHYPVMMSNMPNPVAMLACRRIIQNFRPHIVHTHGGTAGVTGRLAARIVPGVRIVHTYHGIHYLHDVKKWRRTVFGRVESALLKVTDRVICVARKDLETGRAAGIVDPATTVVVLNGIDTARFSTERTYHLRRDPVIGTVGRLHPQKGHRFLLQAIPEVLGSFPSAKFVIIGDGELKDELFSIAERLGIRDSVQFAGSRTDVPERLIAMDLFVLPSLWEGFPIVLLEAMASGLPIVATNVDGVSEMLTTDETALLVPPANSAALSTGILRMLADAELRRRLGERSRALVQDRFGVGRMVRETEAVYRSLTA